MSELTIITNSHATIDIFQPCTNQPAALESDQLLQLYGNFNLLHLVGFNLALKENVNIRECENKALSNELD